MLERVGPAPRDRKYEADLAAMREKRRPTIDRVYHELVYFAAMVEPDGEWGLWKHVYRDFEPRTGALREISLETAQRLYDVIVEHGFGAPLRRYFGESAEECWRDYQAQYAAWSGDGGETARSGAGIARLGGMTPKPTILRGWQRLNFWHDAAARSTAP